VNINWDVAFHFDPLALRPAPFGAAVPTYGNYGGPGYTEGAFGPLVAPYEPPVDALDALFLAHDVATAAAATPGEQAGRTSACSGASWRSPPPSLTRRPASTRA